MITTINVDLHVCHYVCM